MIIKTMAKSYNMDLALMAINYSLYVDNKIPFIKSLKKGHSMPNRNSNVKVACMDFLSILEMVENTSEIKN